MDTDGRLSLGSMLTISLTAQDVVMEDAAVAEQAGEAAGANSKDASAAPSTNDAKPQQGGGGGGSGGSKKKKKNKK